VREQRIAAGARPVHELTVDEARSVDRAISRQSTGAPERVGRVLDREFAGPGGPIPIRVYLPDERAPLPVLVYFFGGGWVLGSIESSDPIYRRLANAARCAVVAVGYRLAPEHRFPAAVEDCYAATCWVAEHACELGLDRQRVAVGGGSAGGNLAAVVALLAPERGGPRLVYQLLVYPVTVHLADTRSMKECGDPYFLDARSVAWCWSHYLARASDGASPLASPLRAPDVSRVPPALVITAENDPVRDEGELYAARLAAAGVRVEHTRYRAMPHGFFAIGSLGQSRAALEQAGRALQRAFDRGGSTPDKGSSAP
jgi:acetyl esterase